MPDNEIIRVKVEHSLSSDTERLIKDMVSEFTRTFASQF